MEVWSRLQVGKSPVRPGTLFARWHAGFMPRGRKVGAMTDDHEGSSQGIRGYLTGQNGVRWGPKEFWIIAIVTAVIALAVLALVTAL